MKNPIKVYITHIDTLSDNTPKSRRRVRATLGLAKDATVTSENVAAAMSKARTGEYKHNPKAEQKGRR